MNPFQRTQRAAEAHETQGATMLCVRDCMMLVWLGLVAIAPGATSRSFADEPQAKPVEVVLQVEASALQEYAQVPPDHDRDGRKAVLIPCRNAFVYLRPANSIAVKKRRELRNWVLDRASRHRPVHHEFSVANGKLMPSAMVIHVGDSVGHFAGDTPLSFGLFSNTPSGTLVASRAFDKPEIIPVKVEGPRLRPSYMLILDHGIAAITNDEGVARFDRLPLGFEFPMRAVCPQIWPKKGIRFESESLDMDGATFLLRADDEAPQRHVIRIVADEPHP